MQTLLRLVQTTPSYFTRTEIPCGLWGYWEDSLEQETEIRRRDTEDEQRGRPSVLKLIVSR